MSQEKYIPHREEINNAEEIMTDEQKKLSKALAPGQEYQVVFVGEKKPMMDFNTKEQKKDKRGSLMFRQKVKLVL